jgi:YVTN family beta-propeller protein
MGSPSPRMGNTSTSRIITPDGTLAYVTNFGIFDGPGATVSVIGTASNTVVATVPVGSFPDGVAVTPDGKHAYVANFNDGTVSVIATASNTVVATVAVGTGTGPVAVGIVPPARRRGHQPERHRPAAFAASAGAAAPLSFPRRVRRSRESRPGQATWRFSSM